MVVKSFRYSAQHLQLWFQGSAFAACELRARSISSCGPRAQHLQHAGLVAPWLVGSYSLTKDGTCVPCIAKWILNYWAARELRWMYLVS